MYENYLLILDKDSCDIKIFNWDGKALKFIRNFVEIRGPLTKYPSLRTTEINYNFDLGKFLEPNDIFAFEGFL